MTIPAVTRGRGAWSTIGKDNGSRWYTYIAGKPEDGSLPTKDANYQAVHLGVKAIQARLQAYGVGIHVDGFYGSGTSSAVQWFQREQGLLVDGVAGPTTCKALWKDLQIWFGGVHHVPASQLYGFMMLESVADPGALGITTPSDRGLSQINENAHPSITDEMAFDPVFAINYTAKRLGDARIKYSGKSADLKNRCAVAQHNSPAQADAWYATGTPPSEQIKLYVDRVLTHALDFKV